MAKKSVSGNVGGGSLIDIINSFDKSTEVLSKSKSAVIREYINTGNYILNAAITGSLFRGYPVGRIVCLAGEPGSGKSMLAVSACREAQKNGYTPIYFDTENAIDLDFVARLGCDPDNFLIRPINKITDVTTFIANFCEKMLALPEESRTKVIFVLDSLGNLTSTKEYTGAVEASGTKDMTKQQEAKALFRVCLVNLGLLGYPMIVTSHVYQTLDLYAKKVISGGSGLQFGASTTLMLAQSKLEDKESDKIVAKNAGEVTKTGVTVKARVDKSRFTIPHVVRFNIPYYKRPNPYVGLDQFVTWENSGIMLNAKMLDPKEYSKLAPVEQMKCAEFTTPSGETRYAYPKESPKKTIVVRHLGEELPAGQLFTPKVLTDELLRNLDENVIKPLFELPSMTDDSDVNEILDEM